MANIKSVEKRARQSVKRHARNTAVLSSLKTVRKRAHQAIASGDSAAASSAISQLSSALDKAAKRGIIHPNAADRGKSRLTLAHRKQATATAGTAG